MAGWLLLWVAVWYCIVFDCFQEHNLRLKPTKYEFFWDEINYLAHHVSKEGMWPSKENLKSVAEFAPSWTYTEIWAFLGLVGHYRQFIKGFSHVVQLLHKHLSQEGACKKSKQVMLKVEAKDAFKTLKRGLSWGSCVGFCWLWQAIYLGDRCQWVRIRGYVVTKTDWRLISSGSVCQLILTTHECNYHSVKQEFLLLKWAIAEQFEEYFLWKLFVVKRDKNPLTYIMTTPNLDATRHQ